MAEAAKRLIPAEFGIAWIQLENYRRSLSAEDRMAALFAVKVMARLSLAELYSLTAATHRTRSNTAWLAAFAKWRNEAAHG